jgi:drug/metabolite transporter (DMT)-like permease
MFPVLLAYFTVYLVWGSTYFAIKEAVVTLHPALVMGFRFSVGGLLLLGLGWSLGRFRRKPTLPEIRTALLLSIMLIVGGTGMVTWAEKKVPSYMAALLIASTPLYVAIFNRVLLKIPVSTAGFSGIVAGLGGVALILFNGQSWLSSFTPHTLIILFGVGSWSLGTSLGKSMPAYPEVMISSGLQALFGGLISLIGYFIFHHQHLPNLSVVSLHSWLGLAYLTVPGTFAFFAYGYLITREPSARVVSYALVNPTIAVLLGLYMGEKVAPYLWFGLPLILLGVFLMLYGESLFHFKINRNQAN